MVEEPIPDSLSFNQLSMACIETWHMNLWLMKIKSTIGPLDVIGASTLPYITDASDFPIISPPFSLSSHLDPIWILLFFVKHVFTAVEHP
jgi:hypothetical protein